MKPLKVSMQAFGPYTEKYEIDFAPLNKSGIFLITGPTGSGKTTILDAMCFALYGSATGENRQWDSMRNTSTAQETPTVAEFEFSLGNDIYRFVRTREFHLKKKRGADPVWESATNASAFKLNDGQWETLADTSKSTTAIATELLGFNRDQFVQVIVLPQGEFKKLLTANSTEKSAILETLFGAKKWSIYAKKFTENAAKTDRELKEIQHRIDGILSGVSVSDLAELSDKTESQQAAVIQFKQQSALLLKQQQELSAAIAAATNDKKAFDELADVSNSLAKFNAQKPDFARLEQEITLYRSVLRLRPSYKSYREYHLEADRLSASKADFEKQLETQTAMLDSLNRKSQYIVGLEQEKQDILLKRKSTENALSTVEELISADNERKSKEAQLNSLADAVSALANSIESKKQELANGQAEWDNIQKHIEQIPSYNAELIHIENEINRLAELNSCRIEHQNEQNTLSMLKKSAEYSKQQFEQAQEHYIRLKSDFDSDSAYQLSATLTDGIPCPVCGSIHHPSPALPQKNAPDKQTVDKAQADMQKYQQKYREDEIKYSTQSAKCGIIKNRLDALTIDCKKITLTSEQLNLLHTDISEKLRRAKTMDSKRAKIEQRKQQRVKEIEDMQTGLNKLTEQKNSTALSLAAMTARIEQLKKQHPEGKFDKSELISIIQQCDKRTDSINNECSRYNDDFNRCNQEISRLKGQLAVTADALTAANEQFAKTKKAFDEQLAKENLTDLSLLCNNTISEEKLRLDESSLNEYNNRIMLFENRKQQLESAVKNKVLPDLDALNEQFKALSHSKSELDVQLGQVEKYYHMLVQANASIGELSTQYENLSRRYSTIQKLALLLNGKNEMSTPIHQFVLGLMLEYVIQSANTYLLTLSKGQYSMRRVDREKGKRGFLGMEIDVIDAHRGGSRDVRTLSGGELFLASLSLAFGLSDTVQSFSGGICVDSLFIDEGFGTLDSETLETAMKALAQIRRSGRIIGIISHVDEIKSRIASHIEISKDDNGHSQIAVKSVV